mmetsp:Transcript_1082/g.3368  ORF Transcript_1082/g.3368 Transcript_1082/m.3368 type:complete len:794 (-) Transcript_1082:114-2495(-)
MANNINMANMEAELRSVLQAVLMGVCQRCDFVHGEALRPSGNACLVQSGASFCSTTGAADFHRASLNFYFPPNVSVAGRVWKSGCTEWHEDVSVLPTTAFLRAELALQTELKAAFAVPLCKDSRVLAVCIFYSRYALPANPQMEQTCIAIANEVLITTFARSHMDTSLRFVPGDPSVIDVAPSKTGASKAWQRCQAALESLPNDRSEDQMEQITKFSKGIHFFKYITNAQRLDLCKTMQHTQFKKNQIVMQGSDHSYPSNIWYVVIHGRVDMCVKTHAEGSTYRMCSFKEGDTFAASYMKMFQTSPSITAHIESATDTSCIMITIPEQYKNDFRTYTRPLWYEELAQYFHISINEAAEALGMCMSAIKKICRRHGISRWPHRKLASVNKTVAMLQSKINTAEDDASRAALRSEAVNVLTMKLRLTINPSYLVRDESVLLQPSINPGGPGMAPAGMNQMGNAPGGLEMHGGMGGERAPAPPIGGGPPGPPPGAGGGFPAGVDAILRQQQEAQRSALMAQAEAQAAANAASVLQKVQNMARARGAMPGGDIGNPMGMGPPQGSYGGPPGGMALQHMQDAMMQQRMMITGQQPGMNVGGGLGRGKDEDGEAFDHGDDFEDRHGAGGPDHAGSARMMQDARGGGGMGGWGMQGYAGMPGGGPGGFQHMAGYPQGGGMGAGPASMGWQGQQGGFDQGGFGRQRPQQPGQPGQGAQGGMSQDMMQQQRRMQDQLLQQQRMMQGFGNYDQRLPGDQLGKRHAIDFLVSAGAGGGQQGGAGGGGGGGGENDPEKRMRHGPM